MTAPRVAFANASTDFLPENREAISQWLLSTVAAENKSAGDLSYVFCSDDFLLEINRNHLNHNYYTDVITFAFGDGDEVSGEVYISVDRVQDNAKELGITFENELHRVMVHGVLHLCGYTDNTREESALMRKKEDYYLSLRPFV